MAQRIYSIDAVRALALLMILTVHTMDSFSAPTVLSSGSSIDAICSLIADFCRTKGMMLFSFLFGLSFFLQMDHAHAKGIDFRARFCLRLFFLFLFGIIHNMFYSGDILIIFALCGFLLVLLERANTWVWLCATALVLLDPLYIAEHFTGKVYPVDFHLLYTATNLSDHLYYNTCVALPAKLAHQFVPMGRGYLTLAMFMLGTIAGRMRFFEKFNTKIAYRCAGIYILLQLTLHICENFISHHPFLLFEIHKTEQICNTLGLIVLYNFLCSRPWVFQYIHPLFSIGRTTLTAYISQGVLLTLLFFDFGMGWSKHMTPADKLLIAVSFFTLQALLSEWWLQFHKFGPLEGIWRRLTRIGMKN